MEVKCRACGAQHWLAEKISRSSTNNPVFSLCCNNGKVVIPVLETPPDGLRNLLERNDGVGRDFRENIWKYNRAFAFTSLHVTEDHSVNERHRGPPIFRIQGELHHRGGSLFPAADCPPTYAQLYFYDPHAALEHRHQQNSGLNTETMHILQEMLLLHHRYAAVYQHAFEVLDGYDPNDDVSIRLRVTPGHDSRRYNLPAADEVAVILPGVDGESTLGIITGNPGVSQGNPYPYPQKPVPVRRVRVTHVYGYGFLRVLRVLRVIAYGFIYI
jgi:hypothetical protein